MPDVNAAQELEDDRSYCLKFETVVSIARPGLHEGLYCQQIDAEIAEEEEGSPSSGKIQGVLVRVDEAINDGEDLSEIFDAESRELAEIYELLYEPGTYDFREKWEDTIPDISACGAVLYLQSIELNQEDRGRRLGLKAVWAYIRALHLGYPLVVAKPHPLHADKMSASAIKKGIKSLRRYWSALGFQPLGRSPYMVLNPVYKNPHPFGDENY